MAFLTTASFRRRNRFRLLWLATFSFFLLVGKLGAQGDISREYQVKAAFLYNFGQFVDWPTNTFSTTNAPIVIGILGGDPFDNYLAQLIRGESLDKHPFIIERYKRVEDVKDCQILFISQTESRRLDSILKDLAGRTLLTVSDIEGFAEHGGMVSFVTEGTKIRLRVNRDVVKAANLTLSAKLLRLAEIVPNKE